MIYSCKYWKHDKGERVKQIVWSLFSIVGYREICCKTIDILKYDLNKQQAPSTED